MKGAEEITMNGNLYRIVADLVKSKGSVDLSSTIQRLRDEIKKVIESPDTMFGKVRGLVDSLLEIIPDEKQRYNAALKALTTTLKLSRREIVKAVNDQLEELKILEKRLLSGIPGWRDELKVMQAASQEIRDEIEKLREKIAQLESEEKIILNNIAAREKDMEVVEEATRDLFSEIEAHITAIKIKLEEPTVEIPPVQPIPPVAQAAPQPIPPAAQAAPQPIPPAAQAAPQPAPPAHSTKSDIPSAALVGVEPESEDLGSSPPPLAEGQKKCPMCGGRMDFHIDGKMWMCYTCAFEEPGTGEVPGKREEKREQRSAPEPAPRTDDIFGEKQISVEQKNEIPESAAPPDTEWQKKCPMCGGRMDFNISGELWICYTCAHEESGTGEVQGKSGGKSQQRNAPEPASSFTVPLTDLTSTEFQELKKGPSPSKQRSFAKTKPCPGCRKKMQYYPEEKAWRCPHCGYERRI
jgi:ribosomal protein L37AE/L43A